MAAIGHWSINCVLSEMGSCLSWSIFFVFPQTAPGCSDPGTDLFFCSVFDVCGLSEVFEFWKDPHQWENTNVQQEDLSGRHHRESSVLASLVAYSWRSGFKSRPIYISEVIGFLLSVLPDIWHYWVIARAGLAGVSKFDLKLSELARDTV